MKLELLENVWNPDPSFIFPPSRTRNLRFQLKWLYRWKWLAYSKAEDGTFCKFCALFAPSGGGIGKQPLGQLCRMKFNNWKDAIQRFNEHENCHYHRHSVAIAESLSNIAIGKQDRINVRLDLDAKHQILENRRNIAPMIETIVLCGRQGLPLRGHRLQPCHANCSEGK